MKASQGLSLEGLFLRIQKDLRQLRKPLLNVILLLVLVESDLREIKDGLEHLKMLKK